MSNYKINIKDKYIVRNECLFIMFNFYYEIEIIKEIRSDYLHE